MCDCNKHLKRRAKCTCVCPEHANFQAAYDLAMQRFDVILDLERQLEQALTAQPAISEEQVEAIVRIVMDTECEHSGSCEVDSGDMCSSPENGWQLRRKIARRIRAAGLTVAGESQ